MLDPRVSTAGPSLPLERASFNALQAQFVAAATSGFAVFDELLADIEQVFPAAWDGSMRYAKLKTTMPLARAVREGSPGLDDAAADYIDRVVPELVRRQYRERFVHLHQAMLASDVRRAIANLKRLEFASLSSNDFNNIAKVLSASEKRWLQPYSTPLSIIKHFFDRLVELSESLEVQANAWIANDGRSERLAAPCSVAHPHTRLLRLGHQDPRSPLSRLPDAILATITDQLLVQNLTYADEATNLARLSLAKEDTGILEPRNGLRVLPPVSARTWASHFEDFEIDVDDVEDGMHTIRGPWLTPRMAYRVNAGATFLSDFIFGDDFDEARSWYLKLLPEIAHPFWKRSEAFRLALRGCYLRVALRLEKGLAPSPNCTGEAMALYAIFSGEGKELIDECLIDHGPKSDFSKLPIYPQDEAYHEVFDRAVSGEDHEAQQDLFQLFDEDERVLKYYLRKSNQFADGPKHLHPSQWFVPFEPRRFRDYEPAIDARPSKRPADGNDDTGPPKKKQATLAA